MHGQQFRQTALDAMGIWCCASQLIQCSAGIVIDIIIIQLLINSLNELSHEAQKIQLVFIIPRRLAGYWAIPLDFLQKLKLCCGSY
ncbi:MAG: hypothetical protein ACUVRK_04595 [Spirochaetota bacterium]